MAVWGYKNSANLGCQPFFSRRDGYLSILNDDGIQQSRFIPAPFHYSFSLYSLSLSLYRTRSNIDSSTCYWLITWLSESLANLVYFDSVRFFLRWCTALSVCRFRCDVANLTVWNVQVLDFTNEFISKNLNKFMNFLNLVEKKYSIEIFQSKKYPCKTMKIKSIQVGIWNKNKFIHT